MARKKTNQVNANTKTEKENTMQHSKKSGTKMAAAMAPDASATPIATARTRADKTAMVHMLVSINCNVT